MRVVVRVVHGHLTLGPARRAGLVLLGLLRLESRRNRGALGVIRFRRDLEIHREEANATGVTIR